MFSQPCFTSHHVKRFCFLSPALGKALSLLPHLLKRLPLLPSISLVSHLTMYAAASRLSSQLSGSVQFHPIALGQPLPSWPPQLSSHDSNDSRPTVNCRWVSHQLMREGVAWSRPRWRETEGNIRGGRQLLVMASTAPRRKRKTITGVGCRDKHSALCLFTFRLQRMEAMRGFPDRLCWLAPPC